MYKWKKVQCYGPLLNLLIVLLCLWGVFTCSLLLFTVCFVAIFDFAFSLPPQLFLLRIPYRTVQVVTGLNVHFAFSLFARSSLLLTFSASLSPPQYLRFAIHQKISVFL